MQEYSITSTLSRVLYREFRVLPSFVSLQIIPLPIDGVRVELQPRIGSADGAVLHMLPGGTSNPEGLDGKILDVYAFTTRGRGNVRGGHYHPVLDELFFTFTGSALWVLSDVRAGSPTHGVTTGVIVGDVAPPETHGVPTYVLADGPLARLRVPHGVYHALVPLTDERVTTVALGSTPYDANDYRYPTMDEVTGARELLARFGI
mgnify:CR=1 FL=1